jgi:hypothetical protein
VGRVPTRARRVGLSTCSASGATARPVDREALLALARDLDAVWKSSSAEMRTKQRLVRALIEELVVDIDDEKREVILVIHCQGGQHSEVRVRKAQPGEHMMRNPVEVDDVIKQMGARWSDEHIAATLNRMGSTTPFPLLRFASRSPSPWCSNGYANRETTTGFFE